MQAVRDCSRFPFLKDLEDNWVSIRQEYEKISKLVEPHPVRDRYDQGWDFLCLFERGARVKKYSDLCPMTTRLGESLPDTNIIGFSRLSPGTHIFPHSHPTRENAKKGEYITHGATCHLGLVVPEHCYFRIGQETLQWEEGKSLVFDPTVDHEAWSDSMKSRIILFIDFGHPLYWGDGSYGKQKWIPSQI